MKQARGTSARRLETKVLLVITHILAQSTQRQTLLPTVFGRLRPDAKRIKKRVLLLSQGGTHLVFVREFDFQDVQTLQ